MKKAFLLVSLCIFVLAGTVNATEKINYQQYFGNFQGTFVLYNCNTASYIIYNKTQAEKRLSPESTFKIFNALTGLQSGVIKDEKTEFQWNGTKYNIGAWNKNQTLASAVSGSVIWCFQDNARKVGKKMMANYLNNVKYGNSDIGGGIEKFWLDSSLKISAMEQVDFLDRMLKYQLPFDKSNIDIVKKVLVLEQKEDKILSGKTGSSGGGWLAKVEPVNYSGKLAWFIGYLTTKEDTYIFATNIEGEAGASGTKAKEVTKVILGQLNLF